MTRKRNDRGRPKAGRKNGITPKMRQDWLFNQLQERGDLAYMTMFTEYNSKFTQYSRTTFNKDWKKAQTRHLKAQEKNQKEIERVRVREAKKMAKQGLKSKYERLMEYQQLVSECLKDLAEGMTDDTVIVEGNPKQYRRKMTINEYNQTRKTLRDLQSEISKIEGDYAAIQTESTVEVKNEFEDKSIEELKAIQERYRQQIDDE